MKANVTTLGCKVNQCESNSIMHQLQCAGFEICKSPHGCDLVILNTCAVTQEGFRKSKQFARRMQKLAPKAKIIICGCATQNKPEEFLLDENILIWGSAQKDKIAENLSKCGLNIENAEKFEDSSFHFKEKARGFVKIQDGCENFCSYCIVPYLRGKSRSKSLQSVFELVNQIENDYEEIVLTGINLTEYGKDLNTNLIELLEKLDSLKPKFSLGSLEVSIITNDFLQRLTKLKFIPNFHLSLQSGSTKVLKEMNRHYTKEDFVEACRKIKQYFPNAKLTTDIIVGFPTETEEDFAHTLDACKTVKFDHIHAFPYSRREGTEAAKYEVLDYKIIKERLDKLCVFSVK